MAKLKELLGKRIKEIRLARNLTQEQLAEIIDIGAASLSKIEIGMNYPTDDNLEKIAKALLDKETLSGDEIREIVSGKKSIKKTPKKTNAKK